jgi:ricin-type beta-trefoil lectin protein/tectonin-like protein
MIMNRQIKQTVFLCALLILNINTAFAGDTESGWTVSTTPTEGPTSDIKIGDHRVTESLTEEKKKSWAMRKVAFVLKLLSSSGTNSTDKWTPKKFSGTSTSIGYDVVIPGTDLGVSTFYTRPNPNTEIWHVALSLDTSTLKSSPLTSVYQDITAILGTPEYESLVIVTSEDNGQVKVDDLPANLKTVLDPFKGNKASNNKTQVINLAKGANFFATIKPPEDGPFKVMEQALLLGGTVNDGSLHLSGSVGYDVLGKLMDDGKLEADKTAQQTAQTEVNASKEDKTIPPVALKIIFPSVIPAPFSLMDAAEAKKSFYMEIDKTFLGIKYDKAANKLDLEAGQDVTLWIDDNDYVTKRKITFAKDKSDSNDSAYLLTASGSVELEQDLFEGFTLKKLSLAGSTKVNFKTPVAEGEETTWQTGSVSDDATRNGGIQIGGHRETTTKAETDSWQVTTPSADAIRSDVAIGENRNTGPEKKKTTELKIVFGVTVNSTDVGDLVGALGLTTIKESGSKPRVKEVFIQFDGDAKVGGLNLGDIDFLESIPLVKDIAINGLGIGMSKPAGSNGLDFYLYSGLTWTKPDIKGQLAVMKRGSDFYVMSRVTDFSVKKVVDSLPNSEVLDAFSKPLEAFEMPNAMLVFSTADGDSGRSGALNLSDLPGQIQTMFNGIVSDSGKVPLYGDGISIIAGIDVTKDENLKKAVDDLGINTTGPIVMGGSLGGFQSGKIKVAFFLDIPKIEFPKKNDDGKDNEMNNVISVNNAGGQFFISIDAVGPVFKTGIRADVEMSLPRVGGTGKGPDIVAMGGDFYLNIDAVGVGVRFAGYTKGDWNDPLGFEGITLKETAILVGTDVSGGLELGLGTTLSFALVDDKGKAKSVKTNDFKKLFDKGELEKRLKELQARMATGEVETKEVDISAGFIIAINTTPALGIPVPKKLGFAFKNSELSLPNTIDIFDLFLKGLMTGPAQTELLNSTPAGSPQRAVLDEIIGGFADGRWVPASQKVQMVSPVPLDVVYFKNVDIFFATPGAILPGYAALDGNIGLRLAGELWVTDLDGKNDKRVGKANIDLTLNGLDFGKIAKDLETTYLSVASVTIDPLREEFNCPKGAFYDVGYASCWSCPKDHKRTLAPVYAVNACKQVKFLHQKAKFEQDANLAWNCPTGTFFDPRNQGECWSCPTGYSRGLEAVDHAKACYNVDLSKIASYSKVTKHKKATGLIGTDCPAGQFWHFDDGNCYSCPSKHIRTGTAIGSDKACMAVGTKSITSEQAASLIKPGRPEGSFLDIGKGQFYSCPEGYKRTVFAVTDAKACEKVEVNLASGKSEPRGQIKTKPKKNKLCFGAEDKDLSIGDNVVMQTCSTQDSRYQSWYLDSLDRLRPLQQLSLEKDKSAAMCLQVEGEESANGTNVKIEKCILEDNVEDKNIAAQQWYVDVKDRFVSKLNNKCLNFKTKEKNLEIWDCLDKGNQFWEFGDNIVKPADIAKAENGPINLTTSGDRSLCIQTDTPVKNGNSVMMNTCGGEENQIWYWNAKGQLSDETKKFCLDIDKDADGSAIGVSGCRDELENVDSQRWLADASGRIANDQGRCIDFADGDSEGKDASLIVSQCKESAAANQLLEMMNVPEKDIILKAIGMSREERAAMKATQEKISQDFGNLFAGFLDPNSMVHTDATKQKRGTGLFKINCPKASKDNDAQFWDAIDGGNCWSCPNKFTRTAHSVKSDKACIGKKSDAGELGSSGKEIKIAWKKTNDAAKDIAIGSIGDVWVIGTGDTIHYRDFMKSTWIKVKGTASKVAVGKDSDVWVLNAKNNVYRGGINGWKKVSGRLTDIAAGANGDVWGIGMNSSAKKSKKKSKKSKKAAPVDPNNNPIYKWNGKRWVEQKGTAARIAVSPAGIAWVVKDDGSIYSGNGKKWTKQPGLAKEIAYGADGSLWRLSKSVDEKGNSSIYKWNSKIKDWDKSNGGASSLGVAPNGQPWATNMANNIFDGNPNRTLTPKLAYTCAEGYRRDILKSNTASDACFKSEFKAATKNSKPVICPSGQEKQLVGNWKNYCISCPTGFSRDLLHFEASTAGACFKVNKTSAVYKEVEIPGRWDSCPSSYKKDPNGSCFKCPTGYGRNANAVGHAKACTKWPSILTTAAASFNGKWGSCATGYTKDLNGLCWKCPTGTKRNYLIGIKSGAKACVIPAASDTEKVAATKHSSAGNGSCPTGAGKFQHLLPGEWFLHCASCPSGYARNANDVAGAKACDKIVRGKAIKALR